MSKSAKATLLIAAYLLLIFAPLIFLLVSPRPAGREFLRELSVGLGFAALTLMGLQFVPTARLPFLADVFPMDSIYYFHHQTSVFALVLVLAHPVLLFINNRYTLRLLDVTTAPLRAVAGVFAAIVVIALVGTSVARKELKLQYETWRTLHDLFTVSAVALAFLHIFSIAHYSALRAQTVLWLVLATIWTGLLIYVRIMKPTLLLRHPYKLTSITPERGDSWTLSIEPVGHTGLSFKPGQFAWLTIQRSPFNIRQHPFSFSSSAERAAHLEFTVKELGDFTRSIKSIPSGQPVYVDGPYGTFGIASRDSGFVFLAGGIGVTPLMSILRTMADRGDKRPIIFFYGSLNWESVTFREELETLKPRLNLQLVHVLEKPETGWQGEKGYISANLLDRYLPANRTKLRYLMCGPLPMITAVEKALQKAGVPLQRVHSERYEMA